MASTIRVDTLQDAGANEYFASDGSGVFTGSLTNTPYARIVMSAAPSVADSTYKLAEYNSYQYGSDESIFTAGTYRITPGVAGEYRIYAHINYAPNAVDQTGYHLLIYKNGSAVVENMTQASGTATGYGTDVFVDGIVTSNDTDYFQIYVYQTSGSSAQYAYGDTSGMRTAFSLFKISGSS